MSDLKGEPMATREKTSDEGFGMRIQAEVFRDYLLMPFSSLHPEYDDILTRLGKDKETRADLRILYRALHLASIGLLAYEDQSRISHFFEELQKYNEGKSFDFCFVMESTVHGIGTFDSLCEDIKNQDQGDFAAEHKSAKAQKRDQDFIPCFVRIMELDRKNNYMGRGQGSGCAKIWNSCKTLQKHVSAKRFKEKFKEKNGKRCKVKKICRPKKSMCVRRGILREISLFFAKTDLMGTHQLVCSH